MKKLFLGDLANLTHKEVKQHIADAYDEPKENLKKWRVLIAYESVGSWGCDSSSWFLLQDKETGELFETYGSHCSCYGFEGQFSPEATSLKYLRSGAFSLSTGGYDDYAVANREQVDEYLKNLEV